MSRRTSFMSPEAIAEVGFEFVGKNVLISQNACFYSPETITIGDNTRIDDFVIMSGKIWLGKFVHIASYASLFGSHGIELGDYCGISIRSTLLSSSEDFNGGFFTNPTVSPQLRNLKCGLVSLKRHCFVGAYTLVMPGVRMGEGTAVAAMSLVVSDTEPWHVYKGNPASKRYERDRGVLEKEKLVDSWVRNT